MTSFQNRCKDNNELFLLNDQNIESIQENNNKLQIKFVNNDCEEIVEKEQYLKNMEIQMAIDEETYYRKNDPIRRYQIDYDASVCLTENYPEAFNSEEVSTKTNEISFDEDIFKGGDNYFVY